MPRTSLFLTMYFAQIKKNDPRFSTKLSTKHFEYIYIKFITLYFLDIDFPWPWLQHSEFWRLLDLKKTTVQDIFIKVLTKLFRYTVQIHHLNIFHPLFIHLLPTLKCTREWLCCEYSNYKSTLLYQDFYFFKTHNIKRWQSKCFVEFFVSICLIEYHQLVQGLKYQTSSRSQVWIRLAWGSCLDIMNKIF